MHVHLLARIGWSTRSSGRQGNHCAERSARFSLNVLLRRQVPAVGFEIRFQICAAQMQESIRRQRRSQNDDEWR